MEATRAVLYTAELGNRYWPNALQETLFKYNPRTLSVTGNSPLQELLGVDETPNAFTSLDNWE